MFNSTVVFNNLVLFLLNPIDLNVSGFDDFVIWD